MSSIEGLQIKFEPLSAESKPTVSADVLLFLHDKWRGYDEIIAASFDGADFYLDSRKVPPNFIAGWLELPIKLPYGSSSSLLPSR